MSNRVPLPAGTVLGKSYEYGIDVNLGTYEAPQWQPVRRISGFAPTFPGTTTEVDTYDDLGADNSDITGRSFAAAFTAQGNRNIGSGLYLPELERILAASRGKMEGAVLDVRFYHKPESGTPNPTDAGRAFVTVEMSRQNTDNKSIEVFSISLTGKGEYEKIANPFTGWAATAPVIASVTPPEAEAGDLVVIEGAGFVGASSVKFGTTSAEFTSTGATIVAAVPTGTAGNVNITVTTPAGTSQAFVYVRGA